MSSLEHTLREIQVETDSDALHEVLRRHQWDGCAFASMPAVSQLRRDLETIKPLSGVRNTGYKHGTPALAFTVPPDEEGTLERG